MSGYTDNFTPIGVVKQGIDLILPQLLGTKRPKRILDPSAGSGNFGKVLRTVFPNSELYAVDTNDKYLRTLREIYDHVFVGKFEDFSECTKFEFDLVITNPPFECITDEFIPNAVSLISSGGYVVFLALSDLGQRSEEADRIFSAYAPIRSWRIPGSIKFRVGTNPDNGRPWGADMRSYSWWVWSRQEGQEWVQKNLPRLSPEERRV